MIGEDDEMDVNDEELEVDDKFSPLIAEFSFN